MNIKKASLLILTLILSLFLLLTGCPTAADPPAPGEPPSTVSTDASLSALGISDGTLIPGFQASIDTYSISVSNSLDNIGITPTAGHASASIEVDGTAVASGSVYSVSNLIAGETEINIVVTAEDETTTQDYTVTVTRAAADSKDITYFAFLADGNGSLSSDVTGVITEGGDSGTIAVTVPFETDITSLISNFAITGVGVTIGGVVQTSSVTENDFTLSSVYRVTASDLTTKDYTVTVSIASSDAKGITSFTLGVTENAGAGITADISGVINEGAHTISLDVPHETDLSGLIPTIEITGVSVSPAGGMGQAFSDGIPVLYTVTASDDTTQEYAVTITVLPSTDATLFSLSVLGQTLVPVFTPGTLDYDVAVANNVTSIEIEVDAADDNANVVIGGAGNQGNLALGTNNFTVTCTAEDGTTILDYILSITRSATPDDGTITVGLTGAGASNGAPAGFAVFTQGSDYIPGNELAANDGIISGGLFSAVAEDSGSSFIFTGGTIYTIYFMIDVNGNDIPDAGDRLGSTDSPIVNGNITVTFNYNDLELELSDDATLSSLSVSSGTMVPAFDSGTSGYTVDVANNITSVNIGATATDDGAVVTGDTGTVGLIVGVNNFTVICTAEDGTVLNYTLTITRAVVSDGTITVTLTGAGVKAGSVVGFGIYAGGNGYIPGTELATGGFIISGGGTGAAVAVDGASIPVIFTGGTNYDIGFMIDDDFDGILDVGEMAGLSEGEVVNGNIIVTFDYAVDLSPYVP